MDFMESLWPGGRFEETIYVALSQLLYMQDVEKQRGSGLKLSYGGKGEKPQTRGTFMGCREKTTHGVDY